MRKLKNNNDLISVLSEAGIKVKEYANPSSIGVRGTFVIGTSSAGRGILIRNTPAAKIEVATDSNKKQAVLSVLEQPIDITRKVEIKLLKSEGNNLPHSNVLERRLRDKFPVHIPGAQHWVSNVKRDKKSEDGRVIVTGDVRAKLGRKRETSFLIGMDETSHFISVLPKKVKTVDEAHEVLKPKGLPNVKGIKRQGEFFFIPTTSEVVEEFIRQTGKEIRRSVPLEKDSNHTAQYAIPTSIRKSIFISQSERYLRGVHFVKGLIYDKRGYRHAPVDLGETWHTVMRNAEKRVPRTVARRYD